MEAAARRRREPVRRPGPGPSPRIGGHAARAGRLAAALPRRRRCPPGPVRCTAASASSIAVSRSITSASISARSMRARRSAASSARRRIEPPRASASARAVHRRAPRERAQRAWAGAAAGAGGPAPGSDSPAAGLRGRCPRRHDAGGGDRGMGVRGRLGHGCSFRACGARGPEGWGRWCRCGCALMRGRSGGLNPRRRPRASAARPARRARPRRRRRDRPHRRRARTAMPDRPGPQAAGRATPAAGRGRRGVCGGCPRRRARPAQGARPQ